MRGRVARQSNTSARAKLLLADRSLRAVEEVRAKCERALGQARALADEMAGRYVRAGLRLPGERPLDSTERQQRLADILVPLYNEVIGEPIIAALREERRARRAGLEEELRIRREMLRTCLRDVRSLVCEVGAMWCIPSRPGRDRDEQEAEREMQRLGSLGVVRSAVGQTGVRSEGAIKLVAAAALPRSRALRLGRKAVEAAVEVAAEDAHEPRRRRLGRSWVKRPDGKVDDALVPAKDLSPEELYTYLRQAAWSEIPGGGRKRGTRRANAGKRAIRELSDSALQTPADAESGVERLAVDTGPSPEEHVAAREDAAELRRAAGRAATPAQRRILALMEQGYNQAETARALSLSRKTVYEQLRRLRRWLGKL